MSILITGSEGFLSKNFFFYLREKSNDQIFLFNKQKSLKTLEKYILKSKYIFHFAGENKPKNKNHFKKNNENLTKYICKFIKSKNLECRLIFSSTVHIQKKSLYGQSKLNSEKIILKYLKNTKAKPIIFRLPNLYGKWAKPNYNSVFATFANNIFKKKKNLIKNKNIINFLFIDDAVKQIYDNSLKIKIKTYPLIKYINKISPPELDKVMRHMLTYRNYSSIKKININFLKKIYSTFLTYASKKYFTYKLESKKDIRGEFMEFLRLSKFGQISFFDINPGYTRGNHFHHLKTEKFFITRGKVKINFKNILTKKKFSFNLSYKDKKVIETIPGYAHSIENTGKEIAQGIVWANEEFNINYPDTYGFKVNEKI